MAGFLLAGCASTGEETTGQNFTVTVTGLVADAITHESLAGVQVTIGTAAPGASGADGWFTVPNVTPGENLLFLATLTDYTSLNGFLTLDATNMTWSLTIVGGAQSQGQLVEASPTTLTFPGVGQGVVLVINLEPTSGDGGGGDGPPGPPPDWP